MRGSITKKGKKYYIILYYKDESGKYKQRWLSGYNKKSEAQKALPSLLAEYENGLYVDAEHVSLKEYLSIYANDYCKPNLSRNSYDKVITAEKKISPYIGNLKLQKIKPIHIQSMLNQWNTEGSLKASSIQTYLRVLHAALEQAIKWQMISNNPCSAVSGPKIQRRSLNILTNDQVHELLEEAKKTPIHPVIMLGLLCGMRRGEILGLQWSNVDLSEGRIFIEHALVKAGNEIIFKETKTSTGKRSIDISGKLIQYLKSLKIKQKEDILRIGSDYKHNDYVCKHEDGTPFRPDFIPFKFNEILTNAELPKLRFQDLRHTHASMLLLAGENPKVIQERLGHSSIKVTLDTYSHLVPSMQKSAAERMESMIDF